MVLNARVSVAWVVAAWVVAAWVVAAGVAVATWCADVNDRQHFDNAQRRLNAGHASPGRGSFRLAVLPTDEPKQLKRFESAQIHMGTQFILILYAPDTEVANRAFAAAFRRIEQLDQIHSDYAPQSELSQLSRSAPTPQEVPLSHDLFQVLLRSQQISQQSHGAFDITVGPLTKLWRRARRQGQLPPANRLATAREAVGHQSLQLNPSGKTATLTKPGMRLDLGGIAKGYAVDQALAELSRMGVCRALVNASGDMAASDPPPNKPGWRIAIAPLQRDGKPTKFGYLANQAIATSGDAFQFVEIAGVRYSHIVDPRTGLGVTDRSSVSVLAPDCTTADGLASATSVLGPQKGLELIKSIPSVEALVIFERDSQVQTRQTKGFASWVSSSVSSKQ